MIGRPRLHLREVGSTNERARELALRGAPHGTLVTAELQTAGRGRQGRAWTAPAGRALLASIVLRSLGEAQATLPLAAAVAVCEACESRAPVRCAIKWPNDVWIGRRKVAGILLEGRPQEGWAVLGVGVNVATRADELPPELRDTATSLAMAGGEDADRPRAAIEGLTAALLACLEARLTDSPAAVLEAWRRRDALRGERVRWSEGEGVAAGIAASGALVVETASGPVELDAGEVHLLSAGAEAPSAGRS